MYDMAEKRDGERCCLLYSWSMAVYCVGDVGMVRHDSWITLRAFEESLFSITACQHHVPGNT